MSSPKENRYSKEMGIRFYLEAFEDIIAGCLKADCRKVILDYKGFSIDQKERLCSYCDRESWDKVLHHVFKEIRSLKGYPRKYTALLEAVQDNQKVVSILTGKHIPTEERIKKVLYENGSTICNQLNVEDVLVYLIERDVITDRDCQRIRAEKQNSGSWAAAFSLLMCLPNRQVTWFRLFVEALEKSSHEDLADILKRKHADSRQKERLFDVEKELHSLDIQQSVSFEEYDVPVRGSHSVGASRSASNKSDMWYDRRNRSEPIDRSKTTDTENTRKKEVFKTNVNSTYDDVPFMGSHSVGARRSASNKSDMLYDRQNQSEPRDRSKTTDTENTRKKEVFETNVNSTYDDVPFMGSHSVGARRSASNKSDMLYDRQNQSEPKDRSKTTDTENTRKKEVFETNIKTTYDDRNGHQSFNSRDWLREQNIGRSWWPVIEPEIRKPYFQPLWRFVEEERQTYRCAVIPKPEEVFCWTNYCTLDQVKVVILAENPTSGHSGANGLAFSVRSRQSIPKYLNNILKELQEDTCSAESAVLPKHGGFEGFLGWANQGVLMLNSVLTWRSEEGQGQPKNAHKDQGWEQFTDAVLSYLNMNKWGLVFMLWGKYAQNKGKLLNEGVHCVLKAAHPSPLSASRGFFGCKHFSKCNNFLTTIGKTPINWNNMA